MRQSKQPASTGAVALPAGSSETCRSSRVVTLFYTDPNNGLASPLSVQRTDDKADYKVVLPNDAFAGTYRVQVAQQTIRAHKATQTCKAAESPAIEVQ